MERRAGFLAAYQNRKWAGHYLEALSKLRATETALGGDMKLTEAAAKSLFKLMAYKDEYEVARLHSDGTFRAKIAAKYEGDYKLNYHLAPPTLGGEMDARGRPKKKQFGPSVGTAFKLMAKFKRLRGTPFDIFGYTAERKMERALIPWFENILDEISSKVNEDNIAEATAIIEKVMKIRGYGPVKEEAVAKIKPEIEARLAKL